ncbi:hypothetical protein ACCC88_01670 [Sphingomonas sp. Sphisp140]|uniref:hypothetical protein n=1 Tax=unclassified Sphingomonas TaxID=196159 RepID=UPI0039B0C277
MRLAIVLALLMASACSDPRVSDLENRVQALEAKQSKPLSKKELYEKYGLTPPSTTVTPEPKRKDSIDR